MPKYAFDTLVAASQMLDDQFKQGEITYSQWKAYHQSLVEIVCENGYWYRWMRLHLAKLEKMEVRK